MAERKKNRLIELFESALGKVLTPETGDAFAGSGGTYERMDPKEAEAISQAMLFGESPEEGGMSLGEQLRQRYIQEQQMKRLQEMNRRDDEKYNKMRRTNEIMDIMGRVGTREPDQYSATYGSPYFKQPKEMSQAQSYSPFIYMSGRR